MNTLIALTLRHLLTGIGGALVAKGYLDSGAVEAIIGALASLGGVLWSVMQKKGMVK